MDDDIYQWSSIISIVFSHSTWLTFLIPARDAQHLHTWGKLSIADWISLLISYKLSAAGGYAQKFRHLGSLHIVDFNLDFFSNYFWTWTWTWTFTLKKKKIQLFNSNLNFFSSFFSTIFFNFNFYLFSTFFFNFKIDFYFNFF